MFDLNDLSVVNSVMKYGLTSFANKHVPVTVLAICGPTALAPHRTAP